MKNPTKEQSIANARLLLRNSEVGVLSTHSKACEGYPFGSVSTFMSTHEGDVIFYISDLAQHTKNIKHDARMCLTVFSADSNNGRHSEDPNAEARLSLLGHAQVLDDAEKEATADRFFRLYPESKKYQKAHDFEFYKMRTNRVRFIGGFGDIHWINEADWRLSSPEWKSGEVSMVQHMNDDHVDAMQAICAYYAGLETDVIEMLALNPDGAFYSCDGSNPIFVPFEQAATDSTSIRKALVAQTNLARSKLGIVKKVV